MRKKLSLQTKIKKRTVKARVEAVPVEESLPSAFEEMQVNPEPKWKKTPIWIFVLLILVIAGVFLYRKGYIVSAIVNGQPVFRWQLTNTLVERFGKQTLEAIVMQKIIDQEAQKQQVAVTTEEVGVREQEMIKNLGSGVKLEDVLAYQGMTKRDLDQQVMTQMKIEKILGKDISISDNDIANFISTNSARLIATESSALKEEARRAILEEAIGSKFQTWMNNLKTSANVIRML